jgi:RNA polymerase sigma-70 factor (ECF subfamily)
VTTVAENPAEVESETADERDLVRRARSGDREAFGGLVLLHHASLYAIAARQLGATDDVQDVLQEAFIQAWRHLDGVVEARPFGPWLRTICRNRLLNFLRDRAARRNRALELVDEALAATAPAAGWEGAGPERVTALRACLETLPAGNRELMRRRYYHDQPVKELAARTGRSEAGMAMLLMRLRQALQACIERRLAQDGAP